MNIFITTGNLPDNPQEHHINSQPCNLHNNLHDSHQCSQCHSQRNNLPNSQPINLQVNPLLNQALATSMHNFESLCLWVRVFMVCCSIVTPVVSFLCVLLVRFLLLSYVFLSVVFFC